MLSIFSTKTVSGRASDAMDTTFAAIFSYFAKDEVHVYVDSLTSEIPPVYDRLPITGSGSLVRLFQKIRLMRRLRPDVLFGTGGLGDIPFVVLKPRKTKYLINFHSMLFRKSRPGWRVRSPWFLRRWLFLRAERAIAISEAAQRTVRGLLPSVKTEMIYSGVALEQFSPRRANKQELARQFLIPFDKPVVAFVGTLSPRKRPHLFAEIARMCPSITFVLVGRPDGAEHFLQHAERLSNFLYIPSMSRDEVATLFASVDALVFPSLDEPFGLVVAEAMASGCPVLASRSGAFVELMHHEEGGYLIPVDSYEVRRFVDTLSALVQNPELRQRMGEAGVARAQNFSWANTAAAYRRVFNELKVR